MLRRVRDTHPLPTQPPANVGTRPAAFPAPEWPRCTACLFAQLVARCRTLNASSLREHSVTRHQPPFRAEHVGSLLRPPALKDARAKRERGEIDEATLKAVEDREIEAAIRRQEAIGLRSITDGEYRRAFWNYDFLGAIEGVEAYLGERKIKFQGANPRPMMLRVIGKLGGYRPHPMIEHFKFVQAHTRATPKMK